MTPAEHKNSHLSPRACLALGSTAGAVGLAASGVATWFYVLGLIELEPSGTARTALIAAGVLLTVGQLAAFGIAAAARGQLLPGLRRTLLALGAALFLFETGSMALTQMALVQSSDVAADAAAARAAELQYAIEARRATATRQRDLAATQAQAQAITAAARSLRAAEASEAAIEPLASELAQLQAARRPTLSTLLGSEQNVALFATARAALIALVGLVMTSTAGALFRAARGMPAPAQTFAATPSTQPSVLRTAAHLVWHTAAAQRAASKARRTVLASGIGATAAVAPAVAATTPDSSPEAIATATAAPGPALENEHRRLHSPVIDSAPRRRHKPQDERGSTGPQRPG